MYIPFVICADPAADNQALLPRLDTQLSLKVRNIVNGLRNYHPRFLMLTVVREDLPRRNEFVQMLVMLFSLHLVPVFVIIFDRLFLRHVCFMIVCEF